MGGNFHIAGSKARDNKNTCLVVPFIKNPVNYEKPKYASNSNITKHKTEYV